MDVVVSLMSWFRPGIVITVKQRQEFRIRLQKRARRVAERKLEAFEEERQAKTVSTSPVITLKYSPPELASLVGCVLQR